MNAITNAIRIIKREIPAKILQLAFVTPATSYRIKTTIDQQLESIIIQDILLDANLIGGITLTVDINGCYLSRYINNNDNVNVIINVPIEQKIIQPLSLTANLTYSNTTQHSSNQPIVNMLDTIHTRSQQQPLGDIYTNLSLIAHNTILISEDVYDVTTGYLELMVENDSQLNNISTRSYIPFAKLATLRTKAYIYNKLVLELEDGSLYYGHNLSKLASIIDSYESSLEEYNEYLTHTWAKIAYMNDTAAMDEHLSLLTSARVSE